MSFLDVDQRRQAHGRAGELRTLGMLGAHFELLRSSIDSDGADHIVRIPSASAAERRARDRSVSVDGIVQSKYFEGRNAVSIATRYASDQGRPRDAFFVIIHTDDARGEQVRYFLTARDVLGLPSTHNGTMRRFAVTKRDDKSRFSEIATADIVAAIRGGITRSQAEATVAFLKEVERRVLIHFELRAGWNARADTTRYFLKNVRLAPGNDPELVGKAVFAHTRGSSVVRAIDARWDLKPASQTWSWGYAGTGPQLLAASILGHYLQAKAPGAPMIWAMTSYLAGLSATEEHVISGALIEAIIAPYVLDEP